MIKFWYNFKLSFGFSSKNRKHYRAGWVNTIIKIDSKKGNLVKSRHGKSFPIPHTSGIPIHTKKRYTIGNEEWYSKTYIFLKEIRFYNDNLITTYNYELKKDVSEWVPSFTSEVEPTDRCQMKDVSYYLPFISITTTYKTDYGAKKDKESDEYFNKEFLTK